MNWCMLWKRNKGEFMGNFAKAVEEHKKLLDELTQHPTKLQENEIDKKLRANLNKLLKHPIIDKDDKSAFDWLNKNKINIGTQGK